MSRMKMNKVLEVLSEEPLTASEVANRLRTEHKVIMAAPSAYHYIRELAADGKVRKHTETKGPRGGQRWEVVG